MPSRILRIGTDVTPVVKGDALYAAAAAPQALDPLINRGIHPLFGPAPVKCRPMATKVFTTDLRVGMFVADLDRPWVDTPFLLQGFIIEDDEQIAALRTHCEYVIVDRARSVGDQFEAAPSGGTAQQHAAGTVNLQATVAATPSKAKLKPVEAPAPGKATPKLKMIRLEEVARGGARSGGPGAGSDEDSGDSMFGRVLGGLRGMLGGGGAQQAGPGSPPCRDPGAAARDSAGVRGARLAPAPGHPGPDLPERGERRGGGAPRARGDRRSPRTSSTSSCMTSASASPSRSSASRKSSRTWWTASCATRRRSCGSPSCASRTSPPTATACRSRCTSPRSGATWASRARSSRSSRRWACCSTSARSACRASCCRSRAGSPTPSSIPPRRTCSTASRSSRRRPTSRATCSPASSSTTSA